MSPTIVGKPKFQYRILFRQELDWKCENQLINRAFIKHQEDIKKQKHSFFTMDVHVEFD
jgi:hypothetical protein